MLCYLVCFSGNGSSRIVLCLLYWQWLLLKWNMLATLLPVVSRNFCIGKLCWQKFNSNPVTISVNCFFFHQETPCDWHLVCYRCRRIYCTADGDVCMKLYFLLRVFMCCCFWRTTIRRELELFYIDVKVQLISVNFLGSSMWRTSMSHSAQIVMVSDVMSLWSHSTFRKNIVVDFNIVFRGFCSRCPWFIYLLTCMCMCVCMYSRWCA